jgi:hypothetical protein
MTDDRLAVAFHEAGHCVVNAALGLATKQILVLGGEGLVRLKTRGLLPLEQAVCSLAGPAAEARFSGISINDLLAGCGQFDIEDAQAALIRMRRPRPMLVEILATAVECVDATWPMIQDVAVALDERGILSHADLLALCGYNLETWGALRDVPVPPHRVREMERRSSLWAITNLVKTFAERRASAAEVMACEGHSLSATVGGKLATE